MQDVVISAKGLTKRYSKKARSSFASKVSSFIKKAAPAAEDNEFYALRDISFEIHRGEIVGVIGHNGAGKSTLLKVLSRITAPTSGHASINGRVGMLLEVGTGFHPDLTGRENVFLGGAILGMSREETLAKYQDIVDFAEIHDFMDMQVRHYSSGMSLRLALAVAINLEADIVFLDEVWAVGDYAFQQKSLARIEKMIRSGRTFLIVSHSEDTIRRLCNRCIMLDHGQVVIDGTPDEAFTVYNEYLFRKKGVALRPGVDWAQASCRCCGSTLETADTLSASVPLSGAFAETASKETYPLAVAACPTCGLVQLTQGPAPDIIRPAVPGVRYRRPEHHLDAVATQLAEAFGAIGTGCVAGVGPFDAPLINRLQARNIATAQLTLIEEERTGDGRYPYLETMQAALSGDGLRRALQGHASVSGFVCRYLLEHCHDPLAALRQMQDALHDDGLLVVEVQDCLKPLRHKDYSALWEEQLCYFTEASLRSLLGQAGLEVMDVLRAESTLNDVLVAVCRKRAGLPSAVSHDRAGSDAFAACQQDFEALRREWQRSLTALAGGRKIAVYGAGHRAVMFINLMGLQDHVAYLVDDAPEKVGKIPPGLEQAVISPAALNADSSVGLCLLAVDPAAQATVMGTLTEFRSRGGVVSSLFLLGQGDTPLEAPPAALIRQAPGLFTVRQPVSAQGKPGIEFLRAAVMVSPGDQAQINLHTGDDDPLQEMLVAFRRTSYIRPQKPSGKGEVIHIIEGQADVVVFNDDGAVTEVISLDASGAAGGLTCRMPASAYHMLLVHSDVLIVHKVATAPSIAGESVPAGFSPDAADREGGAAFLEAVRRDVAAFTAGGK